MPPEKNVSAKERIFTSLATVVPFGPTAFAIARQILPANRALKEQGPKESIREINEQSKRLPLTDKVLTPLVDGSRALLLGASIKLLANGENLLALEAFTIYWIIGLVQIYWLSQKFDQTPQ